MRAMVHLYSPLFEANPISLSVLQLHLIYVPMVDCVLQVADDDRSMTI